MDNTLKKYLLKIFKLSTNDKSMYDLSMYDLSTVYTTDTEFGGIKYYIVNLFKFDIAYNDLSLIYTKMIK